VTSFDSGETGDRLAQAWERHRRSIFENTRAASDWLVDALAPRPGQTVLELTAGPGETGFVVAERVGPDGRLLSSDVSPGMVDAARRGAEAQGLANVEFRVMDAQQLDLPDASVDGVLSRFGVMLVPEPERVLTEAKRVLRPGGRLAYAVWGPPEGNPWLTLFVGAVLQRVPPPPGDPFGAGGPFSLGDPDRNRELATGAGFTDVRVEDVHGAMAFASFDDYWDLQSSVSGPIALLVSSLPAEDVVAIRSILEGMVASFRDGDRLVVPWHAVGVAAGL
jgi:SAM-dependent methyltransferase